MKIKPHLRTIVKWICIFAIFTIMYIFLVKPVLFPTLHLNSVITIRNSGSTNQPGWRLDIFSNGSGNLLISPHKEQRKRSVSKVYQPNTFHEIKKTLDQINDVAAIHTVSSCIKSVSFGSKTTVSYKGKTSGDVSCIRSDAPKPEKELSKELYSLSTILIN